MLKRCLIDDKVVPTKFRAIHLHKYLLTHEDIELLFYPSNKSRTEGIGKIPKSEGTICPICIEEDIESTPSPIVYATFHIGDPTTEENVNFIYNRGIKYRKKSKENLVLLVKCSKCKGLYLIYRQYVELTKLRTQLSNTQEIIES